MTHFPFSLIGFDPDKIQRRMLHILYVLAGGTCEGVRAGGAC